jgi:hypothetical protein
MPSTGNPPVNTDDPNNPNPNPTPAPQPCETPAEPVEDEEDE